MTRWLGSIALGIALGASGGAWGQPIASPETSPQPGAPLALPPMFDRIEKALPPGWTMLATGSELVFRHDKPCYVTGVRHDNPAPLPAQGAEAAGSAAARPTARPSAPAGGGPLVTVELRYRLEPRWSAAQLSAARSTNHKIGADLAALSAKYRIDAIHHSKGRPLPANPDETARLAAYDSERAKVAKRLVPLPHCTAGDVSIFDGEDTYTQLSLELDPPEVIPEAHKVIALLNQHCH